MTISAAGRPFRLVSAGIRPLLAFPCASRAVELAALRCYPGHTWKRRLVRAAMQAAEWSGVGRWLWRTALLPVPGIDATELDIWLAGLTEQFQEPRLYPVFVWPADAVRGRVNVHLLNKAGEPLAFAKIALDKPNAGLIRNEVNALKQVATMKLQVVSVPNVLASGLIQGRPYLVTQYIPQAACTTNWVSASEATDLFARFAGRTWNMPIADVHKMAWWQAIVASTSANAALSCAIQEAAAGGVDVCRVHGDPNGTNMLRKGNQVWLLDWERSCDAAPCLTDATCVQVDHLWPVIQRSGTLALKRFRAKNWDGQGIDHRRRVLMALAFLHAASFTPATELLARWYAAK